MGFCRGETSRRKVTDRDPGAAAQACRHQAKYVGVVPIVSTINNHGRRLGWKKTGGEDFGENPQDLTIAHQKSSVRTPGGLEKTLHSLVRQKEMVRMSDLGEFRLNASSRSLKAKKKQEKSEVE